MTQIQKQANISPVSFSKRLESLTDGQRKILTLLQKSITEGSQVTTDDIIDCYFEHISKDGNTVLVRGNFSNKHFFAHNVDKNHPTARSRAIMWFKQNLGSCIIKGRLLAIPIIEIE